MRFSQLDPEIVEVLKGMEVEVSQEILAEHDASTTFEIIEGLKRGEVRGDAIIQWNDGSGILQANVIDFLMLENIKAIDVETGQEVEIRSTDIPEDAWKLFSS